jgi:RimJ/RimL family protein N-acetyltransferase
VVEIGYATAEQHRRQGLAGEMARGLIAWAAERGATACLASVRPDNVASLALVRSMGFARVGEQIDEIDGLEWIHRLDLTPGWPATGRDNI